MPHHALVDEATFEGIQIAGATQHHVGRSDASTELASILKAVGDVSTVSTQEIPEQPSRELSGLVVDIIREAIGEAISG